MTGLLGFQRILDLGQPCLHLLGLLSVRLVLHPHSQGCCKEYLRELGKAHSQVPTCDERSGNALLLFLPVLSSSRGLWQIPCSSPTPCPQAWTPGSQAHAFLLSSNDTVLRAIWGLGPVPGLAPMFYKALPSEDPACGRRGKQASKQAGRSPAHRVTWR